MQENAYSFLMQRKAFTSIYFKFNATGKSLKKDFYIYLNFKNEIEIINFQNKYKLKSSYFYYYNGICSNIFFYSKHDNRNTLRENKNGKCCSSI